MNGLYNPNCTVKLYCSFEIIFPTEWLKASTTEIELPHVWDLFHEMSNNDHNEIKSKENQTQILILTHRKKIPLYLNLCSNERKLKLPLSAASTNTSQLPYFPV